MMYVPVALIVARNVDVTLVVAAAVMAVVKADPEVVVDPVAITSAIVTAVADMPTPTPEVEAEVADAVAKAVEDAKKNLVRIPLSGQSVPHEQKGKFGGAAVFCCLLLRSNGFS